MIQLNFIYWDPSREMFSFHLPFLNRPILWYGFFFALGFLIGYWILVYLLRRYFLYLPFFTAYDIANTEWFIKQADVLQKNKGQYQGKMARAFAKEVAKNEENALRRDQKNIFSCKATIAGILNRLEQKTELFERYPFPLWAVKMQSYIEAIPNVFHKAYIRHRLILEEECASALISLKQKAKNLAERITLYVVLGTVIGARLGDVIFYQDWREILRDPLSVMRIWEGGLASHGGAVGILIAVLILSRKLRRQYPELHLWGILDLIVVPTAFVASLIRVGNFFNQEILGTVTQVPWAVVFGHPADGSFPAPRHPVQIYEALFYFFTFLCLIGVWKKNVGLPKQGKIFGLFLMLVFGFRFFIEFLKTEQSVWIGPYSFLTMGQYLSIPFFILGVFFFFKRR